MDLVLLFICSVLLVTVSDDGFGNDLQHPYPLKGSKGAPSLPPRPTLVFLIALFGLYVCYLSFNQIRMKGKH